MGQISLKTASGGSVILSPANTASDVTITVPASNATMAINGPAFSAYQSVAQTLPVATLTKITLNAIEFDTASAFNATTSRFTPAVAGYYQVTGEMNVSATNCSMFLTIYKNGSNFKYGGNPSAASACGVSALIYLNGTTDYLELFGFITVSQALAANQFYTYFQAAMVRSA